jgi:hypothetical protein
VISTVVGTTHPNLVDKGIFMPKQRFSKVAFILCGILLMSSTATQASLASNLKETILTKKKEAITDPYYQIKAIKVRQLTNEESLEFVTFDSKGISEADIPPVPPAYSSGDNERTPFPIAVPKFSLGGAILIIDQLIAIGQKIQPAIDKGRAVVNNNPMAAVSVLPRIDSNDSVLEDMGGWSVPVTKHYKITYTNGFGSEVVSFVYSVAFQYGGQYLGKGKYLTGIRASARNITISWGFDLDASSQLIQISNIGSQQNVVAGATVEISYTVKNWTRTITTSESFFVAGDGRLFKLD